jgi:hypothetical protein
MKEVQESSIFEYYTPPAQPFNISLLPLVSRKPDDGQCARRSIILRFLIPVNH